MCAIVNLGRSLGMVATDAMEHWIVECTMNCYLREQEGTS